MTGFYKQEDGTDKLLCPDCGEEVLISEYGETCLCTKCYEEHPISNCSCDYGSMLVVSKEQTTQVNQEVGSK